MATIKDTLNTLICYYNKTRGAGHTQTMIEGAVRTDCVIITHNADFARKFNNTNHSQQAVSLKQIDQYIRGVNKPIAFDNAALFDIFISALNQINQLEKELGANKPWHIATKVELSFFDKIRLLFGKNLMIKFYAPNGRCSASCEFRFGITKEKFPSSVTKYRDTDHR